MLNSLRYSVAALGLLALTATSQAQTVISQQFGAFSDKLVQSTTAAGAYPALGFNVTNTGTGDSANGTTQLTLTGTGLTDSTSTATGIGYTLNYTGTYESGIATGNQGAGGPMANANNNQLLGSVFIDRYGTQATPALTGLTLNITGLNATHSYNLYVYIANVQFSGAVSDTVVDGTQSFNFTTNNALTSLTQITGTTATGDYAEFTGLTGSASTTVTLPGNSTAGFTGFQLVDNGVVPEPSALCFLGLGLLGGGLFLRRRSASRPTAV